MWGLLRPRCRSAPHGATRFHGDRIHAPRRSSQGLRTGRSPACTVDPTAPPPRRPVPTGTPTTLPAPAAYPAASARVCWAFLASSSQRPVKAL